MTARLNRRSFLKVSGLSGAALALGFRLPDGSAADQPDLSPIVNLAQPVGDFVPNAYIGISADGTITLIVHRSEMGQGVATSLPMILADELEADWTTIRTQQAPPDRTYGDQVTGGSVSISGSYNVLRGAGAAARMMLVAAAAQTWGVPAEECRAENGAVIHDASGQQLGYGDLAATAATLTPPGRNDIVLKDPSQFRYIGTSMGHRDAFDFVTGKATFASDLHLPGMLVAVVARAPVYGEKVVEFDASAAEAVEGVRHVVPLRSGVAVVADNTWAALQGRKALKITWSEDSRLATLNTDTERQNLIDELNSLSQGDDPNVLEAIYEIPYLAHSTMEPMVCIADVREDSAEVWAPTQDRQAALRAAQSASDVPASAITLHVPLIGGGFGRRLQIDYVSECVEISRTVSAPVKVFWTRDDDIQHDFYHPASFQQMSVQLDTPTRFRTTARQIYGLPTGAWRSVENFTTAFANECFTDEVAAAINRDPVEFRRDLLRDEHYAAVILAAEKAGWGDPLPEGWGRGIAFHSTFGVTHVATVAEVEVKPDGSVRVHRVVCGVDCGQVINPDTAAAQIEGGTLFGLTAALHGEITVENGRVQQSNFHDYPLLRIDETPQIEVYFVPNDRAPRGLGEMGVPPIAPAVLNAIFAATGKRLRRIPIRPEDLR